MAAFAAAGLASQMGIFQASPAIFIQSRNLVLALPRDPTEEQINMKVKELRSYFVGHGMPHDLAHAMAAQIVPSTLQARAEAAAAAVAINAPED